MQSGFSEEFVIVDLETTGLAPKRDRITEIAAVKMRGNVIIDKFETLVNPGIAIPSHITRITGIHDEMLKDAPSIEQALPKFLEFAGTSTLVAHNANFDMGFLRHHASDKLKMTVLNPSLCTKHLSKKAVPDIGSRALSSLCGFFGIENKNAHRAMSDVKATFQVFNQMRNIIGEELIDHVVESPGLIRNINR